MIAYLRWGAYALLLAGLAYSQRALYSHALEVGTLRTEAAHAEQQREMRRLISLGAQEQRASVVAAHTAQLGRASQSAAQLAQKQRGLDDFFNRLEAASNAAQNPFKSAADAPSCILPDERLRIWRAANAGMDAGAGFDAPESDAAGGGAAAPASAAPAGQRRDAGAGAQPPAGGQDVSRLGSADVQLAPFFAAPMP